MEFMEYYCHINVTYMLGLYNDMGITADAPTRIVLSCPDWCTIDGSPFLGFQIMNIFGMVECNNENPKSNDK